MKTGLVPGRTHDLDPPRPAVRRHLDRAVHVAAWRSTYPGILPDDFLARLSVPRQAAHYDAAIRSSSTGVFVAAASGTDVPPGCGSRIVGFATAGRARGGEFIRRLAEGEVETLYVLDDWRDRGVGRKLMRAAAGHLAEIGCKSCFVWVLRENPSRWFYQRLGGKPAAEAVIQFAGTKCRRRRSSGIRSSDCWRPRPRRPENLRPPGRFPV